MARKGKGRKRRMSQEDKRLRLQNSKGNSNYARKKAWLKQHGKWGFEVPEPKPWRSR